MINNEGKKLLNLVNSCSCSKNEFDFIKEDNYFRCTLKDRFFDVGYNIEGSGYSKNYYIYAHNIGKIVDIDYRKLLSCSPDWEIEVMGKDIINLTSINDLIIDGIIDWYKEQK